LGRRNFIMLSLIKAFRKDERGASATEYAMLIVFVALVVAVGAQTFGTDLQTAFSNLGTTISNWNTSHP
jgi:pilus assembly protein Flp/PilA